MKANLSGEHAVNAVVHALRGLGFRTARASRKSPSRYLRWPGLQFTLRISNHRHTRATRRNYPDTVCSHCVPQEIQQTEIASMALDAGVRFIALSRLRLGLIRTEAA